VWKELECEQRRSAFRISKGRQSDCVERKRCSAVRGILFQRLIRTYLLNLFREFLGRGCVLASRKSARSGAQPMLFGNLFAVPNLTHAHPITDVAKFKVKTSILRISPSALVKQLTSLKVHMLAYSIMFKIYHH